MSVPRPSTRSFVFAFCLVSPLTAIESSRWSGLVNSSAVTIHGPSTQ